MQFCCWNRQMFLFGSVVEWSQCVASIAEFSLMQLAHNPIHTHTHTHIQYTLILDIAGNRYFSTVFVHFKLKYYLSNAAHAFFVASFFFFFILKFIIHTQIVYICGITCLHYTFELL